MEGADVEVGWDIVVGVDVIRKKVGFSIYERKFTVYLYRLYITAQEHPLSDVSSN